jgi:hypothetical protein
VQAVGPEVSQTIGADGGQMALPGTGVVLSVPSEALAGGAVQLKAVQVAPNSLPPLPTDFKAGVLGLQVRFLDAVSGADIDHLAAPISISYHINSDELPLTEGVVSRLHLAEWSSNSWQALPCTLTGDADLTCTLANPGLITSLVPPIAPAVLDWDLANGHFYTQANGFGGSGGVGYGVVDDGDAAMWTEFQRLGGVQQVGYPISGRFTYKGYLTQAFQKLALQWRPDLNQAVPVNVFDELSGYGADAWLDSMRQVPQPADTRDEAGLSFDEVAARRVAALQSYPELANFYDGLADALELYGLPVSVKNYGPVTVVRLQRATLQLWTIDTSFAAAGSVVAGNASDIAREVGLWPSAATAPTAAPSGPT